MRRGSQPEDLAPPPPTRPPAPRTEAEEQHLRPPFRFSPPQSRRARQQPPPPTPHPPHRRSGTGRGWDTHDGIIAGTRTPSPGGGKGHKGATSQQPRKRGGGGRGPQPALGEPGKRPVQAGSPGLSTPSKLKRGRGVAGASTASRAPAQGHHCLAVARGLFALGFTRAATMTSPKGQGRALAPPRGLETPGKGHRRAHNEDTRALGAGPSLAPCKLRVRLGGPATSCFCADPCTHSVQDLKRLSRFHEFWNRGI